MVKLILQDIQSLALVGGYTGLAALSGESAALILSAAVWMHEYRNWVGLSYELTQGEEDYIDQMVSAMEYEVMQSAIGLVIPYASTTPPEGTLDCDGALYLRVDFPELYDVLDPAFIVDANSFNVPDCRNRFVGNSTAQAKGTTGGQANQTLSSANMPTHTHDYVTGTVTPVPVGAGVPIPVPSAPPVITPTTPAGAGTSFSILPPYITLGFCIVAGIP